MLQNGISNFGFKPIVMNRVEKLEFRQVKNQLFRTLLTLK